MYGDAVSYSSQNYVINPNDVTSTTIKQTTLYQPNFYVGNQIEGGGYMTAEQQAIANQRDSTTCGSIGNAGGDAARSGTSRSCLEPAMVPPGREEAAVPRRSTNRTRSPRLSPASASLAQDCRWRIPPA